jgi:DNA repair protein RecN (Recombination protein N)
MLIRLLVKNYLLIQHAELEFSPHLNVLTGETGTGKSILLGALGLALGGRGSPRWVGSGGGQLLVEATFRADRPTQRLARSAGIPLEGKELTLTRELRARGGGRIFVNGHRVLQRTLRRLGTQLVEIHGQRQEERFRVPEVQRDLLDLFGGHGDLRRCVRGSYRDTQLRTEALTAHRSRLAHLTEEEDWIRFQLQEIEDLDPASGETEELRERLRALRDDHRRAAWLALAEDLLNAREGSVLEALETLDDRASGLFADEGARGIGERLLAILGEVRALHRELRGLHAEAAEGAAAVPALEERLSQLERLERKHRKALSEILAGAERMREQLRTIAEGSQREEALGGDLERAEAALEAACGELRASRQKAGVKLAGALAGELSGLGMKGCRVRIVLDEMRGGERGLLELAGGTVTGPSGGERVRFEVETNPGSGFRPLGEVASGGEMARIALALRVILGRRGRQLLTVFDEIDAGLGATAARDVAQRLARVARHRQVLLVTHLPVIAARANRHFLVWKGREGSTAASGVQLLSAEERIAEIARMLSGDGQDAGARRHAASLLGTD